MKYSPHLKFLAIAALCGSLNAATTDPMGGMVIDCPDGSDTRISIPFYRPAVFEGVVDSYSGNQITLKGTPGFTADQFVYSVGVQPNTYFLLVMTGPVDGNGQPTGASLEGSIYTVTANGTDTVTLNLDGGSLAGLAQESVDGTGDSVQIIPFWTLDSLFPDGAGFAASSTFTSEATVGFPDSSTAGTNLSVSGRYFYYDGAAAGGEGWRKIGSAPTIKFDDQLLFNDLSYIVTNSSGSDFEITIAGGVPMTAYRTPINTLAANTAQDNFVGLSFPIDTTLSESRLYESGAFTGSATFTSADTLLVYDNADIDTNKSPIARYFYYTGAAAGGAGWRKIGDPPTTIHDDTVVFNAGTGFVVRKAAEGTPTSHEWVATPSYLLQ